jgi:hypothetical protein
VGAMAMHSTAAIVVLVDATKRPPNTSLFSLMVCRLMVCCSLSYLHRHLPRHV